ADSFAQLARRLRTLVEEATGEEQASLAQDQDAVQVMTVHAAKGLEFPVVAIMKMQRKADGGWPRRLLVKTPWDQLLDEDRTELGLVAAGTVALTLRHARRPREWYVPRLLRALRGLDTAQDLAESRRVFYVAATRAKEHL